MTQPMITAKATGPLFEGRAGPVLDQMERELTEVVADKGVVEVRAVLSNVLRNPSGFYESQLRRSRQSDSESLVDDDRTTYGPWLEGVDSRNKTSRFKGYNHFRKAAQKLERQVGRIAAPVVNRRVRELN